MQAKQPLARFGMLNLNGSERPNAIRVSYSRTLEMLARRQDGLQEGSLARASFDEDGPQHGQRVN